MEKVESPNSEQSLINIIEYEQSLEKGIQSAEKEKMKIIQSARDNAKSIIAEARDSLSQIDEDKANHFKDEVNGLKEKIIESKTDILRRIKEIDKKKLEQLIHYAVRQVRAQ